MRVIIRVDSLEVGEWAAAHIARCINEHAPTARRPFVLGLPAGSSPIPTYRELIRFQEAGRVSFRNVVTFNMDEYVGLPRNHPDSYRCFMNDNLFDHVDIQKKNINVLDGSAGDLDAECAANEKKIERYGGIRLFLGGIGPDGHIAFNEPGASLASRTRVTTLTRETRNTNARFFRGDPGKVPATALTVGVGTVMDAQRVVILVTGAEKARALQRVVERGVNHLWTASALQLHPHAVIVCDAAATAELEVGTVNYFKDLEEDDLESRRR